MARIKTESKREEVLDAATALFLEQGFSGTLMSHISDRAKCSKGTLYSYFSSKEELFYEVVIGRTDHESKALFDELGSTDEPVAETLLAFGFRFLKTLYSPRLQALRRLAFSDNVSPAARRTLYEKGIRRYESQVAQLLLKSMQRGRLRQADATIAATHLFGLLESELLLKLLLGILEDVSPSDLEDAARRAVTTFLLGYQN